MLHNGSLLAHNIAAAQAFIRLDLRAHVDVQSLALEVRSQTRSWRLIPRFQDYGSRRWSFDGAVRLLATAQFAGWLPYVTRPPGSLVSRSAFLDLAARAGLRAPASGPSDGGQATVLLRENAPAQRILAGPLVASRVPAMKRCLDVEDATVEEFLQGDIGRAWYFEGQVYAVELRPKPTVELDGLRPAVEVARQQALWPLSAVDADRLQDCLIACGAEDPAGVVAPRRVVHVDFRYDSPLHPRAVENQSVMGALTGWPGLGLLRRLGNAVFSAAPRASRRHLVFACDFVVDASDGMPTVTGLELEPVVHPDIYTMLAERLFRMSDNPPDWRVRSAASAYTVQFSGAIANASH